MDGCNPCSRGTGFKRVQYLIYVSDHLEMLDGTCSFGTHIRVGIPQ
jgi:hypothetical protein